MKKAIWAAVVFLVLVAVVHIHSQTEQAPPRTDQRGRFQIVFNPVSPQDFEPYLLDTESGDAWRLRTQSGKQIAVPVEKAK